MRLLDRMRFGFADWLTGQPTAPPPRRNRAHAPELQAAATVHTTAGKRAFMGTGIGYGSAASMREMGQPKAVIASADAHIKYDLYDTIAEAQRQYRDNCIYRAIVNRITDFIICEGPTHQVNGDNDRQNREVEKRFADWWNTAPEIRNMDDGPEITRQLVRHRIVDGRIGIIHDERLGQIQLIGGERIAAPLGKQFGKLRIEGGVELDNFRRPVAYWVGEWDEWGMTLRNERRYTPDQMWFWPFRLRNDESTGHPALQAVHPMLTRLADIVDSEPAAWQLLSRMALMVNRENAAGIADAQSEQDPSAANNQARTFAKRIQDVGYALIFHGEPGEEVKGVDRNLPGVNFENSVKSFLRIIGMEMGLSLEFLLLIWSDTNYSSGRASAKQVERNLRPWVQGLRRMLTAIYRWWLEREWSLGLLALRPDLLRCSWHFEPYPFIDPQKEAEADLAEVRGGFTTMTRKHRERGTDLDEVLAERELELGKAAEVVKRHNAKHPDAPITLASVLAVEGADSPSQVLPPAQASQSENSDPGNSANDNKGATV